MKQTIKQSFNRAFLRNKTELDQCVSLQAAHLPFKPLKLHGGQWFCVCWFNSRPYERVKSRVYQSKSEKNRANMALQFKMLCFQSKFRKSGAYWGHCTHILPVLPITNLNKPMFTTCAIHVLIFYTRSGISNVINSWLQSVEQFRCTYHTAAAYLLFNKDNAESFISCERQNISVHCTSDLY